MALYFRPGGLMRRTVVSAAFLVSTLAGVSLIAACDSEPAPSAATPSSGNTGSNSANAARGAEVFARYCNSCHPGGDRGAGPSLIEEGSRLSDGRITRTVRNGDGRMPAFGTNQISDAELPDLIAYIRSLK